MTCYEKGCQNLETRCVACRRLVNDIKFPVCQAWISVKDRLPEIKDRGPNKNKYSDNVLAFNGNKVFVAFRWDNKEIICFDCVYDIEEESFDEITHWMPLPSFPESKAFREKEGEFEGVSEDANT